MKKQIIVLSFMLIIISSIISAQSAESVQNYRIVFYNLENFFDTYIDSSRVYNEFTESGNYHWTSSKYNLKKKNIYKVLQNVGGIEGICLAGICEIENKKVIKDLLYTTPLKSKHFDIIHYNSYDPRGIDVALFYNPHFFPLYSELINVKTPSGDILDSRGILYVKGELDGIEIHIFVNHWTSRYRGLAESEPLRILYAGTLKHKVDSILQLNQNSNVIAIGDFNDTPEDISLKILNESLNNMIPLSMYTNADGSVKFKEYWFTFDQILISNALKNGVNGLKVKTEAYIFDADWLLEKDTKYMGFRPFRTNIGFSFHRGFSDHLPVYIDLIKVK